jgi:hypothetical protein
MKNFIRSLNSNFDIQKELEKKFQKNRDDLTTHYGKKHMEMKDKLSKKECTEAEMTALVSQSESEIKSLEKSFQISVDLLVDAYQKYQFFSINSEISC